MAATTKSAPSIIDEPESIVAIRVSWPGASTKENEIEIMLRYPVAVQQDERISIGRRIANRWRLIGYGSVKSFS